MNKNIDVEIDSFHCSFDFGFFSEGDFSEFFFVYSKQAYKRDLSENRKNPYELIR